jgi:Cu/Ag efflux pump CusA
MTREYQVRVDPEKLIAFGLSISQLEQQLSANNINAGGSFIEQGQQQVNVREVGLISSVRDIEQVVLKSQNGTPVRVKDVAVVSQGRKSVSVRWVTPSTKSTVRSSTRMTSSAASSSCSKAPTKIPPSMEFTRRLRS